MDTINTNPALYLVDGRKVRLPPDSRFRDVSDDFPTPSTSLQEKLARKICQKLTLPSDLVAIDKEPAAAQMVYIQGMCTEDDYAKVVAVLNSNIQLKTNYGNFTILYACVSYPAKFAYIVAKIPRTYHCPQRLVTDLAAVVVSKYTQVTLEGSTRYICGLTGLVTDSHFNDINVVSQGENDILSIVHCGMYYQYLASRNVKEAEVLVDQPATQSLRVYEQHDQIPIELLSYAAYRLVDGDLSRIVHFNSSPISIWYVTNATLNEPLGKFYSNLFNWSCCAGGFIEYDNNIISEFRLRAEYGAKTRTKNEVDKGSRRNSKHQLPGRKMSEEHDILKKSASYTSVHSTPNTVNSVRLLKEGRKALHVVVFIYANTLDSDSNARKALYNLLVKTNRLTLDKHGTSFLSSTPALPVELKNMHLQVGGLTDNAAVRALEMTMLAQGCCDIQIDITLGVVSFLATPAILPVLKTRIQNLGFTCTDVDNATVLEDVKSVTGNNRYFVRWIVQFSINLAFLLLTLLFSFGNTIFPSSSTVNRRLGNSYITIGDIISFIFCTLCIFTNSGYTYLKAGCHALVQRQVVVELIAAIVFLVGYAISLSCLVTAIIVEQQVRLPPICDSLVILVTLLSLCKFIDVKARQASCRPYISLAQSIPLETTIITNLVMEELVQSYSDNFDNLVDNILESESSSSSALGPLGTSYDTLTRPSDTSFTSKSGEQPHMSTSISFGKSTSDAMDPLLRLLKNKYRIDEIIDHLFKNYNEDFKQHQLSNVPTRTLLPGCVVRVQAGYRCPCDGIVVYGTSEVDEGYIAGRRLIKTVKTVGDNLYAGSRVMHDDIYVCAAMLNEDTIIGRIFATLQRSQKSHEATPRLQSLAYKTLAIIGPAILGFGVLVFCIWAGIVFTNVIGDDKMAEVLHLQTTDAQGASLQRNRAFERIYLCFYIFLSILVVACSTALVIAFPIISLAGSSKSTKLGLLLRGCGRVSEKLGSITHVIFSKIGTLTLGLPDIEGLLIPFNVDAMFGFLEATNHLVKTTDGNYTIKKPIKVRETPNMCSSGSSQSGGVQIQPIVASVETVMEAREDDEMKVDSLSLFEAPEVERRMSSKTIDALNAICAYKDLGSVDLVTSHDTTYLPAQVDYPDEEHRIDLKKSMSSSHTEEGNDVTDVSSCVLTLSKTLTDASLMSANVIRSKSNPSDLASGYSPVSTKTNEKQFFQEFSKEDILENLHTNPQFSKLRDKFLYSVAIKCLKYHATFAHYTGNPTIYSILSSIVSFAKGRPQQHMVRNLARLSEFELPEAHDFATRADGSGITAMIDGEEVLYGDLSFANSDRTQPLQFARIDPRSFKCEFVLNKTHDEILDLFHGKDTVALYIRDELISVLSLADTLQVDAKETIAALKQQGYGVYMITADVRTSAWTVSDRVGIPRANVFADATIDLKPDAIRYLKQHGTWPTAAQLDQRPIISEKSHYGTIFICDGMNDLSCLPACDISVAVGSAEQLLKDSTDAVLLSKRLKDIQLLLRFAGTVRKFMRAVFYISIVSTVILLIFCSGVLVSVNVIIGPTISACVSGLITLLVISVGLCLNLYREAKP
ncbi:Copper-transporting P-type ATPase [Giardia muris]|uniref:Copper-transporting P-type ATPase n=1 Tax=Giardia muris TaxID=5742 RepID=A0A4Z1T129_GIAMU|nr:Copper-transporting P-type ATPase [Giardia muris]|eukprot:TNJ30675.1 Copper-transporting P-type ATPase [Giardia muris]